MFGLAEFNVEITIFKNGKERAEQMKNSAFAKIIMVTGVLGLTACGGSDRDETGSVPSEPVADAMVKKA
jgi:hypothetical protein